MAKGGTAKTKQNVKDETPKSWQNRIVGTGEEAPDQLLANPRNWRIHPQAQQEGLEAVLDRVGWVQNVVVNRRTGFMVDGHLRVTLAMRRQEPEVPVVYVDLSPEEEDLILATFDPISSLAGTDRDHIAALLRGVDSHGDTALDALLEKIAEDAGLVDGLNDGEGGSGLLDGADPDAVPEPPKVPVTKPGDLYILGRHRLLCGDSTNRLHVDRLMDGAKADMVFTDPPYGMGKAIMNDGPEWEHILQQAHANVSSVPVQFWWCSSTPRLMSKAMGIIQPHRILVWNKPFSLTHPQKGFAWHLEFCLLKAEVSPKGNTSDLVNMNAIWKKSDPENVGHPTQKPVALFSELAGHFHAALVLDLFGGSGSTLIACEATGRAARLMELDPIYCDVIVRRWEESTGQKAELTRE